MLLLMSNKLYDFFKMVSHLSRSWISRDGPTVWLPRSLNSNRIDFYIWSHLKSSEYTTKVNTEEALRNSILVTAKTINQHRLERASVRPCNRLI